MPASETIIVSKYIIKFIIAWEYKKNQKNSVDAEFFRFILAFLIILKQNNIQVRFVKL